MEGMEGKGGTEGIWEFAPKDIKGYEKDIQKINKDM
jgi:hypothetical protein